MNKKKEEKNNKNTLNEPERCRDYFLQLDVLKLELTFGCTLTLTGRLTQWHRFLACQF